MATIDLGRLGFVNKGTYNNGTTYEKNDLVQFTDGGILSTYLYIDSTAQSGQAPSSSGTAGSRWVYYAKGVADSLASAGNNKVIVTNASGQVTPLSIGSASQVLKVNSGANGFEFGTDAGGGIKQVKSARQSAAESWTGDGQFIGPTATITPASASNKILVIVQGTFSSDSNTATGSCGLKYGTGNTLNSGGTLVGGGDASGNRSQAIGWAGTPYNNWNGTNLHYHILHNPNTTSEISYRLFHQSHDGGTMYLGRTGRDTDNADHPRCDTNITLMEIDSGVL